uniref:oxygen-regulated protein 1 n=1 Tax=Semicossyphus pulcher TaxID=241346 RepID=UPI0037E8D37F
MSNTPVQEPPAEALSTGSGQTLPSRPFQPISDPSASKRVCFYKSGDYTFSGHRMVINARTFKTFDALLDALSKKVPLPFGVRTITTPRGTHMVKALDDLHDGGSYVCSDQRRVKPLNLDEVNRRQVPWNTARPFSAGRRKLQRLTQFGQFGRRNEVTNRPTKFTERVAVRTPKRLEVIKNRDPTVKRTIVLQRRTAPTFDALLDYLSQILQFPVLKLFSTDGRRVDGLAALILCSGVVVAAGNEPFRLGNHSFQRTGQMAQAMYMDTVEPSMLQPRAMNNKSFSSGRGSRNFSLSSERHIVNQINKSRYGSTNSPLHRNNRSFETEVNHRRTSYETCETERVNNEHHACIVPQDDDIEKSFRVNQDGSMTVEMKVHLTIKEEEMLHWTTTLSRTSLSKRTVCASISESTSPDSNSKVAKDSTSISGDELKEENHPATKGVKFNDERILGKAKTGFKRSPTPHQQFERASLESVKMVTESGVQESTLGHYSYMERTAGGETTEGYRVVRHSSSNRPIPKPRKTPSSGAINKGSSHSSIRSSGVAEVLQIQNNGMEVTETVMHIYESQGSYDNYFANEEPSRASTPALESKLSLDSGSLSSSNDCDIDFSCQPPTTDSQQRQKEEMLSLSSEPITQTHEIMNHLSSVTANEVQTANKTKDKTPKTETKKTIFKPARNTKSLTSTSSSDKKQKESRISPPKNGVKSSTDKLSSNASMGKKSLSSSESGQKSNAAVKPPIKKAKGEKLPRKDQTVLVNAVGVKRTANSRQNLDKTGARDNGHNVNTPTVRPQMKKNMSDILQPKKSLLPGRKTIIKPKSEIENKLSQPKKSPELSESFSTPNFKPSLSEVHQYVENWLEKVSPDPVPYTEETTTDESKSQTKVVFQIGADSESDEKTDDQTTQEESYPMPGDIKKSASCLAVPQCYADPTLLHNEHYVRGLCVSMPSVRADAMQMENVLRPHKSVEAIGPADNEPSSSNFLSPQATIKPVLRQIYSSIQCIRGAAETNTSTNLEKSTSLPDFSTQVASVFGSSCKAVLSFLSVMTLRDNLKGSELGEGSPSRSDSEAMLMMQSLQKISAIEDVEEQRASLTDLQSRASSQFRARWTDFQIMRERLESEPLSPRVSETEFALDVFSEGGDVFEDQHLGIDELMEEMNMPQDLRAEICSTIQQSRFFYPVDESTFVETEKNHSDSEEDVEKFVEEGNDETEQPPEPDDTTMMTESETELLRQHKTDNDVKDLTISQTERDELLKGKESEKEEAEQVEEGDKVEGVNDREDGEIKEIDDDDDKGEGEREEKLDDMGQDEGEADKGIGEEEESVVKIEEWMEEEIEDDEEERDLLGEEKEMVEVTEEGLMDEEEQESREGDIAEETDEREGDEETEEEEKGEDEVDGETEEEEKGEAKIDGETEEEGKGKAKVDEDSEEEEIEENEVGGETEEEELGKDAVDGEREEEEKGETKVDEETEEEEEGEDEVDEETEEEEKGEAKVDGGTEEEEIEENEVGVETEEEGKGEDEFEGETQEEGKVNAKDDEESEEEEEGEDEVDEETEEEEKGEAKVEGETEEEGKVKAKDDEESEEEEEGEDEVGGETEEGGKGEDDVDVETEEEGKGEAKVDEESEEEEEEEDEVGGETEEEGKGEDDVDAETEEEGKGEAKVDEESEEEEEGEDEVDEETDEKEKGEDEETEDEVGNIIEEVKEEEELDDFNEVAEEDIKENHEEEEMKDISEEIDLEDEVENIIEEDVLEDREEVEDKTEVVSEEINDEVDEEKEEDNERNLEEEEEEEVEENCKDLEKTEFSFEKESVADAEVVDGIEIEEEKQESEDEVEEENVSHEADSKNLLEEQQQSSFEENANVDTKEAEHNSESQSNYSSEVQCVDDKGDGTDSVNEFETDEGGEHQEERSSGLLHPVEISQELLDFVNSALQCASLVFTYDTHGKIRIEPDNCRVVQTKQKSNIKSRKDSSYGRKCLPSPCCSDLSDYRPETSESGGYQTQESVDIVSESGEEGTERSFPVCKRKTNIPKSKLSVASNSKVLKSSQSKSGGRFSSRDTGTKASKEDLSYFSAGSSQKADAEAAAEATRSISFPSEKDSKDGVLIDQGRWLLKENHLIRTSPPVSQGMYNNADSSSIDTSHSRSSEDSLPHYKTQQNLLAALSSSELEEMAKPKTPKCTYYNMPHGSDSDPFLDDSSYKSGKKDASSVKGRSVRVAPKIDTSRTWANKNGSLSSFASVEFNIPDRKVHPEGEASSMTMARRTSGGGGRAVQPQDSIETLRLRCGQYCPIL